MSHFSPLSQPWAEAQRRAEIYLRALRGGFGVAERDLLAGALTSARSQYLLSPQSHPVTLVMEALFGFLPAHLPNDQPAAPIAPPLQRASMLPEPVEFPLHDWCRRALRRFNKIAA